MTDALIEKLEAARSKVKAYNSALEAAQKLGFTKAIAIVGQHEADHFAGQVANQVRNDRMCINGQWWVPANNYAEANPDKTDDFIGSPVKHTDGTYSREYEEEPEPTPVSLEKCVASMTTGVFATLGPAWRHELAEAVLKAAKVPYVD